MDKAFTERLEKIESVLSEFLPENPDSKWISAGFGDIPPCIHAGAIKNLSDPGKRLLNLGGKRWRPLLLVLCAEMTAAFFKEKKQQEPAVTEKNIRNAYLLTPLVEFCHTASLIHDDIEDHADIRRGEPAAHLVYGLDTAVNSAAWLYFEAAACIDAIAATNSKKNIFYQLYTKELRRLHLGQSLDIQWHRTPDLIPTIDEYTTMVRCKTGTLAALAVQTGILAGGGTRTQAARAGEIAAEIGIGFQILDDVQNLTTGNPGKQRGDDIVEGKKSLPVLLHLTAHPHDKSLIENLFSKAGKEGITSTAV
jgi:octaprenyl-diphosphate synthase